MPKTEITGPKRQSIEVRSKQSPHADGAIYIPPPSEELIRLLELYFLNQDIPERLDIQCVLGENGAGKTRFFQSILSGDVCMQEDRERVEVLLDDFFIGSDNRRYSIHQELFQSGNIYSRFYLNLFFFLTEHDEYKMLLESFLNWIKTSDMRLEFEPTDESENSFAEVVESIFEVNAFDHISNSGFLYDTLFLSSLPDALDHPEKLFQFLEEHGDMIDAPLELLLRLFSVAKSFDEGTNMRELETIYKNVATSFPELERQTDSLEQAERVLDTLFPLWSSMSDINWELEKLRDELADIEQRKAGVDSYINQEIGPEHESLEEMANLDDKESELNDQIESIAAAKNIFEDIVKEWAQAAADMATFQKGRTGNLSDPILRKELTWTLLSFQHKDRKIKESFYTAISRAFSVNLLFWSGKNQDDFDFGKLSSGQQMMLLRIISIYMAIVQSDSKHFLILIDEPDLHLHLNWQRRYISTLLRVFWNLLKIRKDITITCILATHSPFIISDLPKNSVRLIREGKFSEYEGSSFGANYTDILKEWFSQDDSLMGEFAAQMIRSISIIERLSPLFKSINPKLLDTDDEKKLYAYMAEHGGSAPFAGTKKIIWDSFIRDNILYFSKFSIPSSRNSL